MQSQRIVILGKRGRVGAALCRIYGQDPRFEVIGLGREDLDLSNPGQIQARVEETRFDVLINAAAEANVDRCEAEPERAFSVNTAGVRFLAEACARKGKKLIHLSTDYVFDGLSKRRYLEEDPALPINQYGISKRAGEVAVLEASEQHLNVRISWVFGPDRPGFVEQVLDRALRGETLEGVADKWSVPTSVYDIAEGLIPFFPKEEPLGGILHLTQSGEGCTWQEYGQFVVDAALRAGLPLKSREVAGRPMAEIRAFRAKRPAHTVLNTGRFERITGKQPRPWQTALEEYIGRDLAPSYSMMK